MNKSTGDYWDNLEQTADHIKNADCVLAGIGAGMSASGGLDYNDPALVKKWYPEYFEQGKRTIFELLSAFWPAAIHEKNTADFWGLWARHIYHIRYESAALPPYQDLYALIKDKDYFINTTNVDSQIEKAGFDTARVFAPQGNYAFFQCEKPCSRDVYYNEQMIQTMLANMPSPLRIRGEDIPRCPKCGRLLVPNLRSDDTFVEEPHIQNQARYVDFVKAARDKKIVLLELGVGFNTPVIIRYPFEAITMQYPSATLVRINAADIEVSASIAEKSICFKEDVGKVLADLRGSLKR
jgi:NAD-dependent SIR2 family protein deacetylase